MSFAAEGISDAGFVRGGVGGGARGGARGAGAGGGRGRANVVGRDRVAGRGGGSDATRPRPGCAGRRGLHTARACSRGRWSKGWPGQCGRGAGRSSKAHGSAMPGPVEWSSPTGAWCRPVTSSGPRRHTRHRWRGCGAAWPRCTRSSSPPEPLAESVWATVGLARRRCSPTTVTSSSMVNDRLTTGSCSAVAGRPITSARRSGRSSTGTSACSDCCGPGRRFLSAAARGYGSPTRGVGRWRSRVIGIRRSGMTRRPGRVGWRICRRRRGGEHLAGRTLADLMLDRHTVRGAAVGRTPFSRMGTEPLRWLGVNAGLRIAALADAEERLTGRPARTGRLLSSLTGHWSPGPAPGGGSRAPGVNGLRGAHVGSPTSATTRRRQRSSRCPSPSPRPASATEAGRPERSLRRMVDTATLRAYWSHRQGLDGSLTGAPGAAVLERVGWARSVGGTLPISPCSAGRACARAGWTPTSPPCAFTNCPRLATAPMSCPARDFALAPMVGGGASRSRGTARAAEKLGVTREEVDVLAERVLEQLHDTGGAADPAALRKSLASTSAVSATRASARASRRPCPSPWGSSRPTAGSVACPSTGGSTSSGFAHPWPDVPTSRALSTARERFSPSTIGVARHREPSAFPVVRVDSRSPRSKAVAELGLEPVAGTDLLGTPASLTELRSYAVPRPPRSPSSGGLTHSCSFGATSTGSPTRPTASIPARPGPGTAAGGSLTDLPHQGIVDRGRLIGLWDYDPGAEDVVWAPITRLTAAQRLATQDAVARTAAYVRDDLGDNRGMSLDSPKGAPRLAALRAHAE